VLPSAEWAKLEGYCANAEPGLRRDRRGKVLSMRLTDGSHASCAAKAHVPKSARHGDCRE